MKAKKYDDQVDHTVQLTGNKKTDEQILRSAKHMVEDHWQINRAVHSGVTFDRFEIVRVKRVKFMVIEVNARQGTRMILCPMDDDE